MITSDNPRKESPDQIIREIVAGISNKKNYQTITDRRQAIFHAVQNAAAGDVILIAGKGHENYQIIGEQTLDFDDCLVAKEAMQ